MLRKLVIAPVQNAPVNDADVIVIGAGAAGLAATRSLLAGRLPGGAARGPGPDRRPRLDRALARPCLRSRRLLHPCRAARNPWTTIARRLRIATTIDPRRRLLFIGARPGERAGACGLHRGARPGAKPGGRGRRGRGARSASPRPCDGSGPWSAQAQLALGPWLLGAENEVADAADFAAGVSGRDRLVDIGYGRLVAA